MWLLFEKSKALWFEDKDPSNPDNCSCPAINLANTFIRGTFNLVNSDMTVLIENVFGDEDKVKVGNTYSLASNGCSINSSYNGKKAYLVGDLVLNKFRFNGCYAGNDSLMKCLDSYKDTCKNSVWNNLRNHKTHFRGTVLFNDKKKLEMNVIVVEVGESEKDLKKNQIITFDYSNACNGLFMGIGTNLILFGDFEGSKFVVGNCGLDTSSKWGDVTAINAAKKKCVSVNQNIYDGTIMVEANVESISNNFASIIINDKYCNSEIMEDAIEGKLSVELNPLSWNYDLIVNAEGTDSKILLYLKKEEGSYKTLECAIADEYDSISFGNTCESCHKCPSISEIISNGGVAARGIVSNIQEAVNGFHEAKFTLIESKICSSNVEDIEILNIQIPQYHCKMDLIKSETPLNVYLKKIEDKYIVEKCGLDFTSSWEEVEQYCQACQTCIPFNNADNANDIISGFHSIGEKLITVEGTLTHFEDDKFIVQVKSGCGTTDINEFKVKISHYTCSYDEIMKQDPGTLFLISMKENNDEYEAHSCGVKKSNDENYMKHICSSCSSCKSFEESIHLSTTVAGRVFAYNNVYYLDVVKSCNANIENGLKLKINVPDITCKLKLFKDALNTDTILTFHLNHEGNLLFVVKECGLRVYDEEEFSKYCSECSSCRSVPNEIIKQTITLQGTVNSIEQNILKLSSVKYSNNTILDSLDLIIPESSCPYSPLDINSVVIANVIESDNGNKILPCGLKNIYDWAFDVEKCDSCRSIEEEISNGAFAFEAFFSLENGLEIINVNKFTKQDVLKRLISDFNVCNIRFLKISHNNNIYKYLFLARENEKKKIEILPCGMREDYNWDNIIELTQSCNDCSHISTSMYEGRFAVVGKIRSRRPSNNPNHEIITIDIEQEQFCSSTGESLEGQSIRAELSMNSCRYTEIINSKGKLIFYLKKENSKFPKYIVDPCSVSIPEESDEVWHNTQQLCSSCSQCKSVLSVVSDGIQTVQAKILNIEQEKLSIRIVNGCGVDKGDIVVYLRPNTCNYDIIKKGSTYIFHLRDVLDTENDEVIKEIIPCGVKPTESWTAIENYCQSCKSCSNIDQSIENGDFVVEGTILEFSTTKDRGYYTIQVLPSDNNICHKTTTKNLLTLKVNPTMCDIEDLQNREAPVLWIYREQPFGNQVANIVSCVRTNYNWEEINKKCNPCTTCRSINKEISSNAEVFQGRIESVTDNRAIISVRSHNNLQLDQDDKINVEIPPLLCDLSNSIGRRRTFIAEKINNDLKILKCGIRRGVDWDDVQETVNNCASCQSLHESISDGKVVAVGNFEIWNQEEKDGFYYQTLNILNGMQCNRKGESIKESIVIKIHKNSCHLEVARSAIKDDNNENEVAFVLRFENEEWIVEGCGISKEYNWESIKEYCDSCQSCKESETQVSRGITTIKGKLTQLDGDELQISLVENICNYESEEVSIILKLPDTTCNNLDLSIDQEYIFHYTESEGVKRITSCGIQTLETKVDLEDVCQSCSTCVDDEMNIKEDTFIVQGKVSTVETNDNSYKIYLDVDYGDTCSNSIDVANNTLQIEVEKSTCNKLELLNTEGKVLIAYKKDGEVLKALPCGLKFDHNWEDLNEKCNSCDYCLSANELLSRKSLAVVGKIQSIDGSKVSVKVDKAFNIDFEKDELIDINIPSWTCKYANLKVESSYAFFIRNNLGQYTTLTCGIHDTFDLNELSNVKESCDTCKSPYSDIRDGMIALVAVPSISEKAEEGYYSVKLAVNGKHCSVSNKLLGETVTARLSQFSCHLDKLKNMNFEGSEGILFYLKSDFNNVLTILPCGIEFDWNWELVNGICNTCSTCKSPSAFISSGAITFEGKITGSKDDIYTIEQVDRCSKHKVDKVTTVQIPISTCTFDKVQNAGDQVLLFHVEEMKEGPAPYKVLPCGISISEQSNIIKDICKSCNTCKDVQSLIRENHKAVEGVILSKGQVNEQGYFAVNVTVQDKHICAANEEIEPIESMIIYAHQHSCHIDSFVENKKALILYKNVENNGEIHHIAARCGFRFDEPWNVAQSSCDSCKKCESDLLLSEEVFAAEGVVQSLQSNDNSDIIAYVSIKNKCQDANSIKDEVEIIIPRFSCKAHLLKVGEKFLFFLSQNEDGQIIAHRCGIKRNKEYRWREVNKRCNSCKVCTDKQLEDRFLESPIMFSASISSIIEGEDSRIINIKTIGTCSEDMNVGEELTLEISYKTCGVDTVVKGKEAFFFGTKDDKGVFQIHKCGIEAKVSEIAPYQCDLCPNCRTKSLTRRIQLATYIVHGEVLETDVDVAPPDFVGVDIQIDSVFSGEKKEIESLPIIMAKGCSYNRLESEAKYTFFLKEALIDGSKYLMIEECGIYDSQSWQEIVSIASEVTCPIEIESPGGKLCICKNIEQPVCSVNDFGEKTEYKNACVAKCNHANIICNGPCDSCQKVCRYE